MWPKEMETTHLIQTSRIIPINNLMFYIPSYIVKLTGTLLWEL